jgi:predicted AAA+ superfamily ATPase
MLQERVGTPISYESLARDLELHAATVKKYISILEALFIIFIIKPYSKSIARSILKEPKIYFYDTGLLEEKGARFENFVALHLLQMCQFENDYLGTDKELHYIRTKEHKEVDFAISLKTDLIQIIECKYKDDTLSKHLKYFSKKYQIEGIQIVKELKQEYRNENCKIVKMETYFS